MRAFYETAWNYIREVGQGYSIKPGSPEFEAWGKYFMREIGEFPRAYRLAMEGESFSNEFTVPTQWPEWFNPAPAPALVPLIKAGMA